MAALLSPIMAQVPVAFVDVPGGGEEAADGIAGKSLMNRAEVR